MKCLPLYAPQQFAWREGTGLEVLSAQDYNQFYTDTSLWPHKDHSNISEKFIFSLVSWSEFLQKL